MQLTSLLAAADHVPTNSSAHASSCLGGKSGNSLKYWSLTWNAGRSMIWPAAPPSSFAPIRMISCKSNYRIRAPGGAKAEGFLLGLQRYVGARGVSAVLSHGTASRGMTTMPALRGWVPQRLRLLAGSFALRVDTERRASFTPGMLGPQESHWSG